MMTGEGRPEERLAETVCEGFGVGSIPTIVHRREGFEGF